jgi:hypothetical protein
MVPTTDNYLFQAQVNDGIRVTLNNIVIIDALTVATNEISGQRYTTSPVQLVTNTFYPIKIEYFENTA